MKIISKLTLVALLATGSCAQAVNVSAYINSGKNALSNAAKCCKDVTVKVAFTTGTLCQKEAGKVVKAAQNLYSDLATTHFIRSNKYTIAAVSAGTVAVYAAYRFGKYKRTREINAQSAKLS